MDRKKAIAEAIKIAGNEIIENAENYIANDKLDGLTITIRFDQAPFDLLFPRINVDADYSCWMKGWVYGGKWGYRHI